MRHVLVLLVVLVSSSSRAELPTYRECTEQLAELKPRLAKAEARVAELEAQIEVAADPKVAVERAKALAAKRIAEAKALEAEVKARNAACQSSRNCTTIGFCGYDPNYVACRPTKTEHCRRSEACKVLGLCGLHWDPDVAKCEASSNAHCRQSVACKVEGLCFARDGECE